jgi:hypothetical protein
MDMIFATWNIRSVYTAGSLKRIARELDLEALQKVKSVKGGSKSADNYILFYGNGNANCHLGTGFFIHRGIRSAARRVKFIGDRMLYITQQGGWYDITVLHVHAPSTEVKI